MKRVLLMLALLAVPPDESALELRVMKLAQELRCLVCQNETIADSHADLAVDLRKQIREQMIAGRSDKEITTFLTDRYGDFILYRPRLTPKTYALWFGPFVLLAGGLYALYRLLGRWPGSLKQHTLSAEDHRRAEKLLQSAGDPNVAIYRDQLAELDSDFGSGVLAKDRYERDREDLKRRLLEDDLGGLSS